MTIERDELDDGVTVATDLLEETPARPSRIVYR
jgi:hypothetical protein